MVERRWRVIKIKLKSGEVKEYVDSKVAGRETCSIWQDPMNEDIIVTRERNLSRGEKLFGPNFYGTPPYKSTIRMPMSEVEEYTIKHRFDNRWVVFGPSVETIRKEIYRKATYIDNMGITRTTFKKVRDIEGIEADWDD